MKSSTSHSFYFRGIILTVLAIIFTVLPMPQAWGDPSAYEAGLDPAVGVNLISWWNFGATGEQIWQDAIQTVFDAGFTHVSICPVRYFNRSTGVIAASSQRGPELSHFAAAIAHAKSLNMTVTVNLFVEPDGFVVWRGSFDPTGAIATTFWADYLNYMVEVATVAQANGADFLTVGTELKAITQNSGHNNDWNNVINAVDVVFDGQLGYAANWDEYSNDNLTATIWEDPVIDFIGIDAYYPLATNEEADASGTYPNNVFIDLVKGNWNSYLDTTDPLDPLKGILPFAQARKG
jgi:hypothetical protein